LTSQHVNLLLAAADLADRATRQAMADALLDAAGVERIDEAELARLPVTSRSGRPHHYKLAVRRRDGG
jgi:hypothetical protein